MKKVGAVIVLFLVICLPGFIAGLMLELDKQSKFANMILHWYEMLLDTKGMKKIEYWVDEGIGIK